MVGIQGMKVMDEMKKNFRNDNQNMRITQTSINFLMSVGCRGESAEEKETSSRDRKEDKSEGEVQRFAECQSDLIIIRR
jgi:hypothetical protein